MIAYTTPEKTENDWYIDAVQTREKTYKALKHFALCCARVSKARTAALASDCKCSVDTIERYRNAYKLYYQMGVEIETEQVRELWETATIDLWKKAAELSNRYYLYIRCVTTLKQGATQA